jgi:adenosylmethionine-8-amino-7-oxononanoate aminotransferase
MYKPILPEKTQFISPCNPRRDMKKGESVTQYVERLADELERKILDLGPETVAGFVMEPVVGAVRGIEILFLLVHSLTHLHRHLDAFLLYPATLRR